MATALIHVTRERHLLRRDIEAWSFKLIVADGLSEAAEDPRAHATLLVIGLQQCHSRHILRVLCHWHSIFRLLDSRLLILERAKHWVHMGIGPSCLLGAT